MDKDEARKIVEGAFGRHPDLPSGKDFVDEVRHHEPQPDHPGFEKRWLEDEAKNKTRLPTDEELVDFLTIPDGETTSFLEILKRVRDLTAKIVKDEWRVKASDLVAMRAEIAEKKCQAKIEAFIEEWAEFMKWLDNGTRSCASWREELRIFWKKFKATSKGEEHNGQTDRQ